MIKYFSGDDKVNKIFQTMQEYLGPVMNLALISRWGSEDFEREHQIDMRVFQNFKRVMTGQRGAGKWGRL